MEHSNILHGGKVPLEIRQHICDSFDLNTSKKFNSVSRQASQDLALYKKNNWRLSCKSIEDLRCASRLKVEWRYIRLNGVDQFKEIKEIKARFNKDVDVQINLEYSDFIDMFENKVINRNQLEVEGKLSRLLRSDFSNNISGLNIQNFKFPFDDSTRFTCIPEHCQLPDLPHLRRLNINLNNMSPRSLIHLVRSVTPQLEELRIARIRLNGRDLQPILKFKMLQSLQLSINDLTDEDIDTILQFDHLKNLDLYNNKLTNIALDKLKVLDSLEVLNVKGNPHLKHGLKEFNPHLRLLITEISQISDPQVVKQISSIAKYSWMPSTMRNALNLKEENWSIAVKFEEPENSYWRYKRSSSTEFVTLQSKFAAKLAL